MAEVHQLPDMGETERQASEWFARLHADDVTEEDFSRFESWRTAHQLHARVYDEMEATWRAFAARAPLVRAVAFGHSMNEVGAARPSSWRWVAAAAAAVLCFAVALYWRQMSATPESVFQTAIGEHATIELPDGSTLELNTNSLVRLDYSRHARIVRLERGEAFFEVAREPQRPFWVVTGNSWVRAVGTAFGIHLRNGGMLVTVTEGTVKVGLRDGSSDGAQPDSEPEKGAVSTLRAGQQGELNTASIDVRSLSPDQLSRSMGWRSGMIYLENEPLAAVVDEVSRYTSIRIVVNDVALRELRLSGTFQAGDAGAESFLAMLEDGFGLSIRREAGSVYVEPARDGLEYRGAQGLESSGSRSARAIPDELR